MQKNKRICVYTCITGDYDELQPIELKEKNVDYICFTNNKKLISNDWKIIYIDDKNLDNHRLSRKIKMLGHPYISENYDISVWMDARIIFKKSVLEFVKTYLKNNSFAAFRHHKRNCIYDEAVTCLKLNKDTKENILKIVNFLSEENYPKQNGLYEMTVFIKKHNDPLVIKTMELWFNMVCNYSKRDQLSFMYCVWKTGLKIDDINLNVWDNDWFYHKLHNPKSELKKCRIYFGDDEKEFDYNLFYEKDYNINENIYSFEIKIPVDTNIIKLNVCDIPCMEYDNLKIEGINISNIEVYNKMEYNGKSIFFNDYGFICIKGDFKKNDIMHFSVLLKLIDYSEALRLIEMLSNDYNKMINKEAQSKNELDNIKNELENTRLELNQIYNSKSWKMIKPIRKIGSKIRKIFKKRK